MLCNHSNIARQLSRTLSLLLCSLSYKIACEQALWGALAAEREKDNLQLRLWNLNICIEKVDAKCGNDISNEVITLGTCFSRFAYIRSLVSASRWLAEIWQLSWRGSTGKLEVEFKFQRRGCKLSFLFPPRFQSTTESLLPVHIQSGWWMGNLEENGEYYASVQTSSWKWAYENKKRKEKQFLIFFI